MVALHDKIDLTASNEQIALDVTHTLVPSQIGLMDNETARSLIHHGILLALAESQAGAGARWEYTLRFTASKGTYSYTTGRYRQRNRARNEAKKTVARYANGQNPLTVEILRRPVMEGVWQDA